MGLKSQKILGISISSETKENILEYIRKCLDSESNIAGKKLNTRPKFLKIFTPNPEQIVFAYRHPWFAKILNQADIAIPDGIGLVFANRLLKLRPRLHRIAGVDFMENLVEFFARQGYRMALIGGKPGVAVKALECLSRHATGLHGWAVDPEKVPIEKIAKKIRSTDTRIVFVGLGAPKQEIFIERLRREMSFRPPSRNPGKQGWIPDHTFGELSASARDDKKSIVLMSVGGSLDILAGRLARAPQVYRLMGLEWFWRLIMEPWRWKRQLALLKFLDLVFREKLASRGRYL